MRVRTPDGVGEVIRPQVLRGRTSYLVRGPSFEGWYDDDQVYKLSDFSDPPPMGPASLMGDFSDITQDPDTERDDPDVDVAELPWDDEQLNTGDPTTSTLLQDETDSEDSLHYDEDKGSDLPHHNIPSQAFYQPRESRTHSSTSTSVGRKIGHLKLSDGVDTDPNLDTGVGSNDMSGTNDDSYGPMSFDEITDQSGFEGDLDVSTIPSTSPTPGTGKSFETFDSDGRGGDFSPKTTSLVDPLSFLDKVSGDKPGYSKRRNPLGDTPFDRQEDYKTDETPWFMKNRVEDQPCAACGQEGPHQGEACAACGALLKRSSVEDDDKKNHHYRATPGYTHAYDNDGDDNDDSSSESSDGSDGDGDSSGGGDGGTSGGGSTSSSVGQRYKRTRGPKKSQPLGTHPLQEEPPSGPLKNKRLERGIKGEEASKPTRGRKRKTPAQPKGTHFGGFDLHFAANLCTCSYAPLHSKSEHLEVLAHCGMPGCPKCGSAYDSEGNMLCMTCQEDENRKNASRKKAELEKGPEFSGSAVVDFADNGVTKMDGLTEEEIQEKYPGLAGRGIPEDPDSDDSNLNMAHLDQILTSTRTSEYKYIKKRGDKWVILQKGTGKVLSHHDSEQQAQAAFRAMMVGKYGKTSSEGENELYRGDPVQGYSTTPEDLGDWVEWNPDPVKRAEISQRYRTWEKGGYPTGRMIIQHIPGDERGEWSALTPGAGRSHGGHRTWHSTPEEAVAHADRYLTRKQREHDRYEQSRVREPWPDASRGSRFTSSVKTSGDPQNQGAQPQGMPMGGMQQQQMQIEMQVEQLMKFWAVDNFGWWHWTGSQQDLAMLNQMQQSMMPVMQPTMEPQGAQQEPGTSPMGPLASQSARKTLPKGQKY